MSELPKLVQNPLAVAVHHSMNQEDPLFEEAFLKKCWDDLEPMYQRAAEALVAIGEQIHQVVSHPLILNNAVDVPGLRVAISGLTRDLETFTTELVEIKKRHSDLNAGAENDYDLSLSLSIFSDYSSFNDKIQTILTPTVISIISMVGEAVSASLDQVEDPSTDSDSLDQVEEPSTDTVVTEQPSSDTHGA